MVKEHATHLPHDLVISAIALACMPLLDEGMEPPQAVVPGVEGSITMEWHDLNGTYTEIEIVRPQYARCP